MWWCVFQCLKLIFSLLVGYLIMSDDWFSEFVYEVVIDKKFLTEEILAVTKQTPVVLPAWDPMGALAKLWVVASDWTLVTCFLPNWRDLCFLQTVGTCFYQKNNIISIKISILCNICWITVDIQLCVVFDFLLISFLQS